MSLPSHFIFKGNNQPPWSPALSGTPQFSDLKVTRKQVSLKGGPEHFFYIADGFLNTQECQELIRQFDTTTPTPMGVDGYMVPKDKDSIGSYRTNCWTVELAQKLSPGFFKVIKDEAVFKPVAGKEDMFQSGAGVEIAIPTPQRELTLAGTTPYLRFMRYFSGGKHAPHYDALFMDTDGKFVTLLSWVIYLNTPRGTGGEFQFVEDGQGALPPSKRDRSDWKRMATESEVTAVVAPKEGRLLIFPHWLPHQVQLYQSDTMEDEGRRIIIRGDVAYTWK